MAGHPYFARLLRQLPQTSGSALSANPFDICCVTRRRTDPRSQTVVFFLKLSKQLTLIVLIHSRVFFCFLNLLLTEQFEFKILFLLLLFLSWVELE